MAAKEMQLIRAYRGVARPQSHTLESDTERGRLDTLDDQELEKVIQESGFDVADMLLLLSEEKTPEALVSLAHHALRVKREGEAVTEENATGPSRKTKDGVGIKRSLTSSKEADKKQKTTDPEVPMFSCLHGNNSVNK